MPPRKRPPAGPVSSVPVASPSTHLAPFLSYLEAECGMSKNTLRAYRSDLAQFFEWFLAHGPGSVAALDGSAATHPSGVAALDGSAATHPSGVAALDGSAATHLSGVAAVELPHLSAYLKHLHERQMAASSIARHLVSIKMFFRFLVLEGVLTESKVELLSSPKLWQHLPKVLSPETVDRLLAAPQPGDRYPLRDRALLAVMYATGCRASEVANLQSKDVQLTERVCRCTGKGNKERIVALNPVAIAALEAYLEHERPRLAKRDANGTAATHPSGIAAADGSLFLTRNGNPLGRIMVWHLVKKYAARVGCSREVSPHTLRHSFATHMLAGGAEIRALQELLGHASISTTQIYTHVEHSRLKAVHQKCHPRG